MSDVLIGTRYGEMSAYVAVPAGAGPWPGVVVVHDFAGMTRDVRTQADWLAGEGFLAAAPDLYYWGGRLRCLWTIMRPRLRGLQHQLRRLPPDAARRLSGTCAVVGSYGRKDRSPMGASAAKRLEHALTALGTDHDIKVYPDAGHGFTNDHDPADMTPLLTFLSKISRTHYHEPSAIDAHRRIAAFFSRHLNA